MGGEPHGVERCMFSDQVDEILHLSRGGQVAWRLAGVPRFIFDGGAIEAHGDEVWLELRDQRQQTPGGGHGSDGFTFVRCRGLAHWNLNLLHQIEDAMFVHPQHLKCRSSPSMWIDRSVGRCEDRSRANGSQVRVSVNFGEDFFHWCSCGCVSEFGSVGHGEVGSQGPRWAVCAEAEGFDVGVLDVRMNFVETSAQPVEVGGGLGVGWKSFPSLQGCFDRGVWGQCTHPGEMICSQSVEENVS